MRTRLPLGIFVLVVTVLIPIPGLAAEDNEFEVLLEANMPELLEIYGVSGSVVSLIANGAVVWTTAYGVADVESGAT